MKKYILSLLLSPLFLFAYNYDYELGTSLSITDEINANRDEVYPNLGISIIKNIDLPIFNQIDLSYLKSKKLSYKSSTSKTYVNKYATTLYNDNTLNKNFKIYTLFGLGYQEFTKKMNTMNSLYINYGLGLKYKLSSNYNIKFDGRHMITKEEENSLAYTFTITKSFGKPNFYKPLPKTNRIKDDFRPF